MLSAALLIIVLVYIYPLRVMIEGMFAWFSQGYLPTSMALSSFEQLSFMFVFLGVGFTLLCLVFLLMYWHALRCADQLLLNETERFDTRTLCVLWLGFMGVGLIAIVLAVLTPPEQVPWTGFTYMLMTAWGIGIGFARNRPDESAV